MKYFILVLSMVCALQCLAQDPRLYENTWYLYGVLYDDNNDYEVYLIDPPISPYLIISEHMEFSGQGACNSFSGVYDATTQNFLIPTQFTNSTDNCEFQVHNGFENSYFGVLSIENGYGYSIVEEDGGLTLRFDEVFGSYAIFKSYPLSTPDLNLNEIKIYPNPSSSRIYIKYLTDPVTKVELYNLQGQSIETFNQNLKWVDVSNLTSGIYLVKISTDGGTTVKRIIKK